MAGCQPGEGDHTCPTWPLDALQFADWERGEHLQSFVALAWPTFNRMICRHSGCRALLLICSRLSAIAAASLLLNPTGLHRLAWVPRSINGSADPSSTWVLNLGAQRWCSTWVLTQHHQARGGGAAGQPRRVWARLLCAAVLRAPAAGHHRGQGRAAAGRRHAGHGWVVPAASLVPPVLPTSMHACQHPLNPTPVFGRQTAA